MSDTDYTDYFADMDQDAEETAEFERIFTAAAWYCTASAIEFSYKPEPIRRDRLGGGLRVEKDGGAFRVSVAAKSRTSVVLDLDKIPADTYEYSIVPDNPGDEYIYNLFCVYVIPRSDGTLKGSPAYVKGGYIIIPMMPRHQPLFTSVVYGSGIEHSRPLRSFIGSPRECAYFCVAKSSRSDDAKDLWQTEVTDLTGSPDIVRGRVDLSHCPSLTSAKGAPRRVEWEFDLRNTRVRPWDDDLRCVPLFGDGVRREVGGNIIVSASSYSQWDAVNGRRTKKTVNIGRPGSGKYGWLAGLIADNCSCGTVCVVDIISAMAVADIRRDLEAANEA